jgi:hypothetical protein
VTCDVRVKVKVKVCLTEAQLSITRTFLVELCYLLWECVLKQLLKALMEDVCRIGLALHSKRSVIQDNQHSPITQQLQSKVR